MSAELLLLVESAIRKVSEEMLEDEQLLDVEHFWGDDFLLCFQEAHADESWLFDFAAEFRQRAVAGINEARPKLLTAPLDLHVGCAVLDDTGASLDRQLYLTIKRAVKRARRTATGGDDMHREFRECCTGG